MPFMGRDETGSGKDGARAFAKPLKGWRKHMHKVAPVVKPVQRSGNGVSRYNWQSLTRSARPRGRPESPWRGGADMVSERSLAVLRVIVQDYVETREPVGSKSIVERHSFGVSSATIRNDMAQL